MDISEFTGVDSFVVLIEDERSEFYGRIGKVISYDLIKKGTIDVLFANGRAIRLNEGSKGPEPSQAMIFYRRMDEWSMGKDIEGRGPVSFIKRYLELGGKKDDLHAEYRMLFGYGLGEDEAEEFDLT